MSIQSWSYLLAFIGIVGLWFAAKRPIIGFAITLVCQPIWTIYAIVTGQPGFIVAAVAYVLVYGRLLYMAREEKGYNERDKERLARWVAEHLPKRVRQHVVIPVVASVATYPPASE